MKKSKEYDVIEKLMKLIDKKYSLIEKTLNKTGILSKEIAVVDSVFKDSYEETITELSNISSSDLSRVLDLLIKEQEAPLRKSIEASHFLMKGGIELVDAQKEMIKELFKRATDKRKKVSELIQQSESDETLEAIETYDSLLKKLEEVKAGAFLDNDTIKEIFSVLNIKDEEKSNLLDDIIEHNNIKLKELQEKIGPYKFVEDDKIEVLEIEEQPEIIEAERKVILSTELKEIFDKYGYDMSILNEDLVNYICNNGDLENIDKIFESLEKNNLEFLKGKDERTAKFLTRFLLESSAEIIDARCQLFMDNAIELEELKGYKLIFLDDQNYNDEQSEQRYRKRRRNKTRTSDIDIDVIEDEPADNLFVGVDAKGKSRDFDRNLSLLETFGYSRRDLILNQNKLLTMPTEAIIRHINELKTYGFPLGKENFPLSALHSNRIMELTDGFIELGEEQYILRYSSRLTAYVDGTLERLYALKKLGVKYKITRGDNEQLCGYVTDLNKKCGLTKEQIEATVPKESAAILKGNEFSELLNTYLPSEISEETINNPIFNYLDKKNKISELSYNFDGVIISRKKLLRNYEFLMKTDLISAEKKDLTDMLFISAINNSRLSMEEIEKVNNGLSDAISLKGDEVKNAISKK